MVSQVLMLTVGKVAHMMHIHITDASVCVIINKIHFRFDNLPVIHKAKVMAGLKMAPESPEKHIIMQTRPRAATIPPLMRLTTPGASCMDIYMLPMFIKLMGGKRGYA